MNSWAMMAAEHATLTSGTSLSVIPGLGSAALNGFAFGALAGGTYYAVLRHPWRDAGAALPRLTAVRRRVRIDHGRPAIGLRGLRRGGEAALAVVSRAPVAERVPAAGRVPVAERVVPERAPVAERIPVAGRALVAERTLVAERVPVAERAPVAGRIQVAGRAKLAELIPAAEIDPVAERAAVAERVAMAQQAAMAQRIAMARRIEVADLVPATELDLVADLEPVTSVDLMSDAVPVAELIPAMELAPLPEFPSLGPVRCAATRPYSDIAEPGRLPSGRSVWMPDPERSGIDRPAQDGPASGGSASDGAGRYLSASVRLVPAGFSLAEPDEQPVAWIADPPAGDSQASGRREARVRAVGRDGSGRARERRPGIRQRLGGMLAEIFGDDEDELPQSWDESPDEIFWGPADGRESRPTNGYQSKHRLKDPSRGEPKQQESGRRAPRHAAPSQASASAKRPGHYSAQPAS